MIKFLLLIHFAGMSIFLGNITATLIWKLYAERSRVPYIIQHVLHTAISADKFVTVPSVLVITLSGILLVIQDGISILNQLWLQLSIGLWLGSAVAATSYLIPSLKRLAELATEQAHAGELNSAYYFQARRWNITSLLLILMPLIILVLMVMKPFV